MWWRSTLRFSNIIIITFFSASALIKWNAPEVLLFELRYTEILEHSGVTVWCDTSALVVGLRGRGQLGWFSFSLSSNSEDLEALRFQKFWRSFFWSSKVYLSGSLAKFKGFGCLNKEAPEEVTPLPLHAPVLLEESSWVCLLQLKPPENVSHTICFVTAGAGPALGLHGSLLSTAVKSLLPWNITLTLGITQKSRVKGGAGF